MTLCQWFPDTFEKWTFIQEDFQATTALRPADRAIKNSSTEGKPLQGCPKFRESLQLTLDTSGVYQRTKDNTSDRPSYHGSFFRQSLLTGRY
jgi:hypothetical protein